MSKIFITKNQFFELNRRADDIIQQQNELLQAIQDADMASLVKTYEYLNLYMPEWGRSTLAAMQKFCYINGTEDGKYNLSEDLLRLLVFFDRGNIGKLGDSSVTRKEVIQDPQDSNKNVTITYNYLEAKNRFDDYFARIAENEISAPVADNEGNLTYPDPTNPLQINGNNIQDNIGRYNISFDIVTPVINQTTEISQDGSIKHWRFKYAGNPQFDTIEQIYGYFSKLGFGVAAICGLLGNALQECGNQTTFLTPNCLNIKAVGIESDGTRSRGIWQFNEKSFPDSRALGNVWEQCELLKDRIGRDFQIYGSKFPRFLRNRGDANASKYQTFNLDTYKKMTDPGYAALAFCVVFERCADEYVLPRGHLGWVALNELFEQK